MDSKIAIVGIACHYPHARSPQELWENVLAQRRAFRRIPPERLRLEDYYHADRSVPDKTYSTQGAFIEDYEFNRFHFRISGNAYRASDLTHWLALDVANHAVLDAGYLPADLPSQMTGVIVGNSLTGEFSRANAMRLRWPYVHRVVESALRNEGWSKEHCRAFLQKLEKVYKEPFPPVGEESLAGGLSNTIAGRICNYFNLKGGGYTVDGACSSSLLAVATACSSLVAGDVDLALAGGVDLSIDPFELIGFAKTSALTENEMHVYDVRSSGFLPGEGCGFVVLMRYEDAVAQHRQIYSVISGWGISSDGSGGITRPEAMGQSLALARAYQRSGTSIEDVSYFEGHGTGTSVGDATELQAILHLKKERRPEEKAAVIGSVKATIGHTKAAAGIAGLIKTVMALHTQIIPPTTGNLTPLPVLTKDNASLKTLDKGMLWPDDVPLRAAVSAMGFGGINTHVVLEGTSTKRRSSLTEHEHILLSSAQDCELFLWRAHDREDLLRQIEQIVALAPQLSLAEFIDLAAFLSSHLVPEGDFSIALVASTPSELVQQLQKTQSLLLSGTSSYEDRNTGIYIGQGLKPLRPGFLFTSQGAPAHIQGGIWRRRFRDIDDLYIRAHLPVVSDGIETSVAQPAIVTASLAALRILQQVGIHAHVGIGHSLGELTAFYWAGVFAEATLLHLVRKRGWAMSTLGSSTGKMASLQTDYATAKSLIATDPVVIAGINSPGQTVISGDAHAIETVVKRAAIHNIQAILLPVSHAFHSPLVADAVEPFAQQLLETTISQPERLVISTVTGRPVAIEDDIRALLTQQITAPVRFLDALVQAQQQVDIWVEVGPGTILQKLALDCTQQPALALDAGGSSLKGLLHLIALFFTRGTPLNLDLLYKQRFSRPFDLQRRPRFLVNPCEQAPLPETPDSSEIPVLHTLHGLTDALGSEPDEEQQPPMFMPINGNTDPAIDLIRQIVAHRAELPVTYIENHSRMLSDLHLNSITVGQIISEAARSLGVLPPVEPTQYADATVTEMAQVLETARQQGNTLAGRDQFSTLSGIDTWVRCFVVEQVPEALPLNTSHGIGNGKWEVVTAADVDNTFVERLHEALNTLPFTGVLVYLEPQFEKKQCALLLQSAKQALRQPEGTHFVLIQQDGIGSSLARTLALETPQKTVCVIDIPDTRSDALSWIMAEVQHASGYQEAHYDQQGKRTVPRLRMYTPISRYKEEGSVIPGPDDVLLVTGGGKGIAAECAFELARTYGIRLALLGRSLVENDDELANNLYRMETAGIQFHYYSVDVTDIEQVRQVVHTIETTVGTITAFLHGAGMNVPRLLSTLEEHELYQTLAPKLDGFTNIVNAIDPGQLRLLVTFGSIIARTGMRGEADYALANDWLARLTEKFQGEFPGCHCLCIEWSIWSGVGMGERLGRVEALMHEGILPITPDAGVNILLQMLQSSLPTPRVVVSSRLGTSPTLKRMQPELPFLRFLENIHLYYPKIELIADVSLSTSTDLYLEDHKYKGERLLPAVVGLEAMTQCAMAVSEHLHLPTLEQVQLSRPIVVPEHGSLTVRIAALVRENGNVEVVLRSEESGFQVDHFRAICDFTKSPLEALPALSALTRRSRTSKTLLELHPHQLYGNILFHQRRFQRIRGYLHLHATECIAAITPVGDSPMYAHYLPGERILGDFTARDAYIHAIQACIPHTTLLPVEIEKISFVPALLYEAMPRYVHARERERRGERFIYDIEVYSPDGQLVEQWQGLHLQQVQPIQQRDPWAPALFIPYIERRLAEVFQSTHIHIAFNQADTLQRSIRRDETIQSMLGQSASVHHRPDGKPMIVLEEKTVTQLSIAHTETLTLVVSSTEAVSCDVEEIVERSNVTWLDMLGAERHRLAALLASNQGEDYSSAATRVWAARECLKKESALVHAPLMLVSTNDDGWILLRSGNFLIATWIANLQKQEKPLVFAVGAYIEF